MDTAPVVSVAGQFFWLVKAAKNAMPMRIDSVITASHQPD